MNIQNGLIESGNSYIDWELLEEIEIDEEGNESVLEEYVRINNIFVDKDSRGKGLARLFLETAIKIITKEYKGLNIKIVAEPKDSNTDFDRLVNFYDSFSELEAIA